MNTHSVTLLETKLAIKLRELLGEIGWLRDWRVETGPAESLGAFDIRAEVPLPHGHRAELWVDCEDQPRPSRFPNLNLVKGFSEGGRRRNRVPVLAAPHISPRMAELCRTHGWSWFDLAGNCRLDVPNGFLIERTGNEPAHRPREPAVNLGTREAGRIVRALLAPVNLTRRWTQRDLARHCEPEVSIGLVNKVVSHLREQAFLTDSENSGFALRDPMGLLAAWREAYRFHRHQRVGYFTLRHGSGLQTALSALDSLTGGNAAYASFSAADFQAPHVRQPKTWLYVGAEYLETLVEALEARPVDSGENLVVLVPDDPGVFSFGEASSNRLRRTNAAQTYVDLSHSGGRGQEAAEALLEQNLKREWRACGFDL